MSDVTRRIGLSLGADLCWPICYQEILNRLDLAIPSNGDHLRFEVERLTIEPFDLRQPCRYDLVIDRLTHWYFPTREWIKKSIVLDGLYVFNNPWSIQSMEKQTTYSAMMRLGLPIPDTWLVPPKEYDPREDLQTTLHRYARHFNLGDIGKSLGYPLYMKPYDGGAWKGVSRVDDERSLRAAYEQSGKLVMHLQAAVEPHDLFIRCIGLGPQTRAVVYDPTAPLHDRYTMRRDALSPAEEKLLRDMTLTINSFFGWDFNSCEALRSGKLWRPIDFANACPDSQVTSLHYHFPWLIKANIRWSIFTAATKRRMRLNLDWRPFFAAVRPEMTLQERLEACAAIAHERFETERFEEFCATHLPHLDEVAHEFFGSETAREAVRQKVASLFPAEEVEEFTELFWERIQRWRNEPTKEPELHGTGGSVEAARDSRAASRSAAEASGAATRPAARNAANGDHMKETTSWHSERLGQEVGVARWGAVGVPFLIFPTAGGDAEEIERFHVIDTLAPHLEAGRIKVYSCDSVAGRAMLTQDGSPEERMAAVNRFQEFVYREVVPAIRMDCNSPDIEVVAAGSSIGAFYALAMVCRYPDAFRGALCMSGSYDLLRFLKVEPEQMSPEFRVSSPLHFVPELADDHLARLRRRYVLLASGRGRAEDIDESWRVARVLGRQGVPNRVDDWGEEWHHDWPTWRNMLHRYAEDLSREEAPPSVEREAADAAPDATGAPH